MNKVQILKSEIGLTHSLLEPRYELFIILFELINDGDSFCVSETSSDFNT